MVGFLFLLELNLSRDVTMGIGINSPMDVCGYVLQSNRVNILTGHEHDVK